jgi:hypothetical protein
LSEDPAADGKGALAFTFLTTKMITPATAISPITNGMVPIVSTSSIISDSSLVAVVLHISCPVCESLSLFLHFFSASSHQHVYVVELLTELARDLQSLQDFISDPSPSTSHCSSSVIGGGVGVGGTFVGDGVAGLDTGGSVTGEEIGAFSVGAFVFSGFAVGLGVVGGVAVSGTASTGGSVGGFASLFITGAGTAIGATSFPVEGTFSGGVGTD